MSVWEEIKWSEVHAEALALLKRLIQFETVNPPGNEKPAAEFLADLFRREGLAPEVIDTAPGRACVVCRLKGTGEKPPLLLNGHLDVVAAEADKWSVPPFAAVEKDGFLYGRGAVDMKNMVAMSAMSLIMLKRAGAQLKRDLIFCGVADEEAGGQFGSQFMVANHADKVRAEYSLSEMGGFSTEIDGKRFYLVQVAEKGVCWLKITTRGEPGHGSMPDRDSALLKAAAIAERLGRKGLKQKNVPAVVKFVELMAANLKFPKNVVFKLLLNPAFSPIILDKVMPDKGSAQAFAAMLRNTANPTIIHAGDKTNVIPSEATLEIDGRLLPGTTTDEFLMEVRQAIGPEPEIEVMRELTPTEAPADDPIFTLFTQAITRLDPGAVVVPNLVTGFTDATHWKKLGMKCYGFSPLKLPPDMAFKSLFHGHDERIPLAGYRFGLEALFEVVCRVTM